MAILNVIGETHSDFEHAMNQAAALDLSMALAATAPRGCGVQHLVARERELPRFNSPRVRALNMGVSASVLATLWHTRAAAKPLAGSLTHSLTPLVPLEPLRKHGNSGSQTTVTVGHLLPYTKPDIYGKLQAQSMRRYIKRAIKHADAVLAPSFAAASAIKQRFPEADPQILTLAAPTALLIAGSQELTAAKQRRAELGLPDSFFVTIKSPVNSEILEDLSELAPQHTKVPIVIIDTTPEPAAAPLTDPTNNAQETDTAPAAEVSATAETDAIITVRATELCDIAAILAGAIAYIAVGTVFGQGYDLYAALAAGKPIIYYTAQQAGEDPNSAAQSSFAAAETPAAAATAAAGTAADTVNATSAAAPNLAAEIAQEAGIPVADSAELWQRIKDLPGSEELQTATVIAGDRSGIYNWENTARTLWQIHAEL